MILLKQGQKKAFSLVEVVLAIGVLSVAIIALLGLFAPTMTSVKGVLDRNRATAVMTQVNAFLRTDITQGPQLTDFDDVYEWASDGHVLYIWEFQEDIDKPLEWKIERDEDLNPFENDFDDGGVEGNLYVVIISNASLDFDYAIPVDDAAYVPMKIAIYGVAPDFVLSQNFNVEFDNEGISDNSDGVSDANLLFSYTAVRNR